MFEAPCVEPVFLTKEKVTNYSTSVGGFIGLAPLRHRNFVLRASNTYYPQNGTDLPQNATMVYPYAMLEVKGLTKSYGKLFAADGICFRADSGETVGLLGPNGAGKTTTVSIIAGLLSPDSGEVLIANQMVKSDTDPVKLSAYDNLTFFAALYSMAGAPAREAIIDALNLVGLSDRPGDKVQTFSGGMKRRLNLAAALLHDPARARFANKQFLVTRFLHRTRPDGERESLTS